jgi:uncharacterized protein YoxC
MGEGGALLLQVAQTARDTPVVRMLASERSGLQQLADVARSLMTVAVLVLTVALVPAAWSFRKSYKRINDLLDRVYGDINPIVRHLSTIADNVDYISTSVRVDIQQVNRTVAEANQRVNHALALSEQRLNEFNALLQVVQREAEVTFVNTASVLRGVRAGVSTFQREALAGRASWHEEPGREELIDGDSPRTPDDITTTGPRIRPRPRPGGAGLARRV